MIKMTDAIGHTLTLSRPPSRIISLVPSLTELIVDLGAADQLVGITKFCVHPPEIFQSRTRVGGTKKIHIDRIRSLNPDLIIANQEENVKEQIESLRSEFPVYTTAISTVEEACTTITDIGQLIAKESQAISLRSQIERAFDQLKKMEKKKRIKVLYLIWKQPYMSVGGDTFIHDMLAKGGFENVCAHWLRYPTLDPQWIEQCDADAVWLSSEPFPFKESHFAAFQSLLPQAEIRLVDGEYLSWYGSRMTKAAVYLKELQKS